jgi:hypothetical protein
MGAAIGRLEIGNFKLPLHRSEPAVNADGGERRKEGRGKKVDI